MKSKLFKILKLNLKNTYNINKLLTMSKSKILLYIIVGIYVLISLVTTGIMYSNGLISVLEKNNLIFLALPIFAIVTGVITFVFSIFSAKNMLFESKDNDLLLALPIKPSTILLSRLLNLLIFNTLISSIIFIPTIITYALKVNVDISYYLITIIATILIPIIPTVLAAIFGYLVAYLTSKVNIKNLFEYIFTILLVFVIMYIPNKIGELLNVLVNNPDVIIRIIKYVFMPIYLISQALVTHNYLYLLGFIIINIIILILFIIIFKINYQKTILKLKEHTTKKNYHLNHLNASNQTKALLIKEISKFIKSPIYIFNMAFGVVILFVLSLITIFYDKNVILGMFEFPNFTISELLVCLTGFVIVMTNTSCVSLSLEGSNLWILKSLPIETNKIFNAKKILNYLLILPLTILSTIILVLAFKVNIIEMLLIISFIICLSMLIVNFGIIANLIFPRFEFNNEAEIIKRSMSSFMGIFTPMLFFVIIIGIFIISGINFNIYIIILDVIFIILLIIEKYIIKTWGVKKFNLL